MGRMVQSNRTKLTSYINYRVRISLKDGRQLIGRFMAFDRHLNIVLGDCEECLKFPKKKVKKFEISRILGLTLLRGETLVSILVEGPPPSETIRTKLQTAPVGPGIGRAMGRGIQSSTTYYQTQEIPDFIDPSGNLASTSLQPLASTVQNSSMLKLTPGLPPPIGLPLSKSYS